MAEDAPASWPRSHFRSGGGTPLLFFVVYGDMPRDLAPSFAQYRIAGVPEGIDLVRLEDAPARGSYFEGYPWEQLLREDPALAARIEGAPDAVILHGEPAHPETLDYLRDVLGLVTYMLDNGGLAVYDPQTLRWWSAADWRRDLFEPAGAVARHHVVILFSEEEDAPGLYWYHTRGMRKFGRPDISVRRVSDRYRDAVIDMINRLIELEAFGAVIPEGEEIRMASLPDGTTCHHAGDLDDLDFNNVHLEVRLPAARRYVPGEGAGD